MRSMGCLLFALTGLSCATVVAQQSNLQLVLKVPNAVAVGGVPGAGYYVLAADNVVYRYVQTGSGLQFKNSFPLATPGDGTDLAFAPAAGQDAVVVTQWADKVRVGFIRRYTPEGKVIGTWQTRHVPTGVDFDVRNGRIYFATLDSNELYSADVHGGGPNVVCAVRGAYQLGPIALDGERQLIYTSDAEGRLLVVDLASKRTTQLSPVFGLASALRLDSQNRILYVADHVKKKVYAVDLSSQNGRVVAESEQLMNPSGLALGPDNKLLISDLNSGGVYLGKLQAQQARRQIPRAAKRR